MSVANKVVQAASTCDQSWFCPFFSAAADVNLGVVLVGGLLGGLLQPVYSRLHPDQSNPPIGHYFWTALLGLAAAGISVYIVADSKTDEPIHLLFFSVLCGLAFPSILTSAVNNLSRQTEQVKDDIAKAAEQAKSNNTAQTADAADQIKNTLARNPADSLTIKGGAVVDATAQIAVQNIADTAAQNTAAAPEVINQLQQVGSVAKTAGYTATVEAVEEELNKLSSAEIGDVAKAAARKAVEWLNKS